MTAVEALGCQACGLPITPCLVCASPLPVSKVDDSLIKTCCSCGVVNPLGDKYREVLDIPPTSALPSPMVRRAQISRVGRRPYVLAKHAHFMHFSSVSKRKGDDEQDGGSESHGLAIREMFARIGPKGAPVPEIFASAEEGHPLTFLPYMQDTGARVHQEAVCAGRKAVDARRFYPFSDSESPVKRMRLSPRQEVVDQGEKNLSGSVDPTLHQVQVAPSNGGSVAAVSNGRTSIICTPLKHDPANPGELTGKLAAGFTAEPPVQSSDCHSTPFKTRCKNDPGPTIRDADDGEVWSTAEGGMTSIPLEGPLETLHNVVEHEVGVGHQLCISRLIEPYVQSIRSTINGLDVSKSPSGNAQRHEGRAEAPTSGAAVSNCSVDQRRKYFEHDFYPQVDIENSVELPSTSMQKVDAEEQLDAHEAEGNNPVRDLTGSEEVPTRRHERVCSECGQMGERSGRSSSNVDEAELMRCCTQILELHCPHTLIADMRTPCAYPLCCPVPMFPLPAGSTSSSKVCRSYVTQFTVDALRAAHSTLTSSTQESTSEEVASPLRGVEQALSMAERFIDIKDRMGHVHGLIEQVDAASAQASRDFKAYGDRGAFSLASQLIPRLLSREKQQNVDRAKNDVQVMTAFLQDINKLLTTCFQYVGKILEASLSSVGENRAVSFAGNLNVFMLDIGTKPGLEAVRTAVPLWLRLYHDVAHASGLLK